jgi:hypothetical protein
MTPLVSRSILREFSIVLWIAFIGWALTSLAVAQHPVGHPGGTVVHAPAPPVFRAPMAQPVPRSPVMYAPGTAPRMSTVSPVRTMGAIVIRPPHRPIRPVPVIIFYSPFFGYGVPFWGFNSCGWTSCDLLWPWTYETTYISSPGPVSYAPEVYSEPPEVYGEERPDFPELDLRDGTVLNVSDYWVVDNQLHFMIVEEEGAKPTEEVIPFDALDLQKTIDENSRRGFRFMLRNEPFEQYVRDHPEGTPPEATSPRK